MVIRVVGHVACGAANFTVYKLYGRVQGGNRDEGRGRGVIYKNGVVAIRAGAHQQGNVRCNGSVWQLRHSRDSASIVCACGYFVDMKIKEKARTIVIAKRIIN